MIIQETGPANTRTVYKGEHLPQIRSGYTKKYGYVELDMICTPVRLDNEAAQAVEMLFREISNEPLPPRFVWDTTHRWYGFIGRTVVEHERVKKDKRKYAVEELHRIAMECMRRQQVE